MLLKEDSCYLGIESPESECGKTTLMTLISKLVNRPLAASNVSSPAFYRAIHEMRPTLLIDEADTLLPGNAQLRGILNAGYTEDMAYVLRVVADLAGGDWPELARQAAIGLSAKAAEHNPMSALLLAIWLSFRVAGGGRIFSKMLVQGLNSMEDQPWGQMRNGKGITVEWLAKQLERHGIRPKTIRIGEAQTKGYYEEDFKDVFQRYMSRSDLEKTARLESALPWSEFGATRPPATESGAPSTEEQKKDEPGEAEGGETEAA